MKTSKTGFCLQYDEHGVALAEVRPMKGTWRVEAVRRTSAATGPEATLLNRLKRLRAPLTLLAPDADVNHGIVNTPALRGKALKRALAGGVARDEGGTPTDWRLSYKTLAGQAGKRGDQLSHFLIYSREEKVAGLVNHAEKWGVMPTTVLPEFLILDQFFRAHGPGHDELKGWNLVFLGQRRQFLNMGTTEVPLLVRDLPADLSGGRDRAEYIERLATEIDRSLHFARQVEPAPNIGKVLVCGDPETCTALVERLAQDSPVEAVHWAIEDMFTWGPYRKKPDDLLLLMAAALNFERPDFNLLPKRGLLHLGAEGRRQLRSAAVTAATVALPLLIGGGILTTRVQDSYLVEARARVDDGMSQARAAEAVYHTQKLLLAREDKIVKIAGDKPDLEAVLLKLADLTPEQVVFTSLVVTERAHGHFLLRIEGTSDAVMAEEAQAAFLEFLARLDASSFLLRRTEPQTVRLSPGDGALQGRKTTVFQMDVILKRDGAAPVEG